MPSTPDPVADPASEQASHRNVAVVAQVLAAAGASGRVVELADAVRTAADAAAALGCEVAAIANSLVFMADGEPVLILTSGAHRVDTAHVANLLGVGRLRRATPDQVRTATGQPIGGVAPVGHPQPVRTLVDVALREFPVVWAAGGIPHAVFPTTFEELVRITGGEPVTVTPEG
jgi:prolyl-tRNA editing enzyme YbaK/EbsC (Cys-tRNA(Pro) deacylase)